jgi:ATP-dependent metalloprotease FtsH
VQLRAGQDENPNRHYHYSKKYYEDALQRLHENNLTSPNHKRDPRLNFRRQGETSDAFRAFIDGNDTIHADDLPGITIILKGGFFQPYGDDDEDDDQFQEGEDAEDHQDDDDDEPDIHEGFTRHEGFNPFLPRHQQPSTDSKKNPPHRRENPYIRAFRQGLEESEKKEKLKSKNFEVIKNYDVKFNDVGGYEKIKDELRQSVDLLRNYGKYAKYNVRIPKGLILEGPPGNGKTLLAKSLAGEAGCGFIAVSGADFQEKYVGVGSSRIREMFDLAKKNEPCIIFIDEIDAVGRHRSGDGESSSSERDNTLNALLVELDGFKNNTGVFVVGATNRIDLLDPALVRPGRIDKKIYIGIPDATTRREVIRIHIQGKPHDESIVLEDMVDTTDGLSCAQIENLLNEAMLYALRYNNTAFTYADVDVILNKIIAGWQSTDHGFTEDMIERIAVHEMGHALLGYLSKYHSKLVKVVLNLSSPRTPGYTVFERSAASIYLKEALFEHMIILLGGRIAEEVVYNVSVTTGAINDFEEALKLAERMIVHYGMGEKVLYPSGSEKYKEIIDNEVSELINYAYLVGRIVLENCKSIILESSAKLITKKKLIPTDLSEMIHESYPEVLKLKEIFSV